MAVAAPSVTVRRLLPERRLVPEGQVACGSCCCCCLHLFGGLVGAHLATTRGEPRAGFYFWILGLAAPAFYLIQATPAQTNSRFFNLVLYYPVFLFGVAVVGLAGTLIGSWALRSDRLSASTATFADIALRVFLWSAGGAALTIAMIALPLLPFAR